MSARFSGVLGAAVLILMAPALASRTDYLLRDERLCDATGAFCLLGTLSYQPNPRLLHLRARVQKAPGPGVLRIVLAGSNRLGHRRLAPFEVRVRGNYSEIVNHRMIPDHPDTRGWAIERVEFIADSAA